MTIGTNDIYLPHIHDFKIAFPFSDRSVCKTCGEIRKSPESPRCPNEGMPCNCTGACQ